MPVTALPVMPANGEWSREAWLGYADLLLAGARAWASPNGARINPPGAEGGYGRDVDGLEGFARTFLLAGFRIAGARGEGVDELIEQYRRGIAAGVDPDGPDRWVRMTEHPQAKVEAASIALILDLTRPWIWDRLGATTQQRVVDYLSPAVGDDGYPRNNWLWFRLTVQTFLRSVGGPWSPDNVDADLELHDSFVREEGWMSDGDERSYDHYVGWALQLYPVLWSRMRGASELAGGRTVADVDRLDRFLQDAIRLVGADGSPLLQGRSLIYRFAAAAPFWIGVLAEVPSLSPGALRHAANRVVGHFAEHGVPDERGLLTMGWHGEWRTLAQSYSGPASPYWAAKGMLGISLPADHPVWNASPEPLPAESQDTLRAVRSPGWLIAGTAADGIVRVVNHGTDHANPGALVGDSPLYARLGYSTATSPLLDELAWREPLEQSVSLVDAAGNATHRAAMELRDLRVEESGGQVGVAVSTWNAHWLVPAADQQLHGSGLAGQATIAGRIAVCSLVRGAWELRLARVESLEPGVDSEAMTLRVGGWAIAGAAPAFESSADAASASSDGITSRLQSLRGDAVAGVEIRADASPLGAVAATPVLAYPVVVGDWTASLVELCGAAPEVEPVPERQATVDLGDAVVIGWPDGVTTASDIPYVRSVLTTDRHSERAPIEVRGHMQRSTKE